MKSITKLLAILCMAATASMAAFAVPSAVTAADSIEEFTVSSEILNEEQNVLLEEGTQESPYTISNASEFNNYANLIKTDNAIYASKYYKLSSNVDFSECELVPFGTASAPFKGTFDGNGYALLNVSVADVENSGVIGYMTQGAVNNLSVKYSDSSSREEYTEVKYFGGIIGYASVVSSQTISVYGCQTDGNLMLSCDKALYAGGMIGSIRCESGNASVTNCVSFVSIDAESKMDSYVSGFAAYVLGGSSKNYVFKNCISYGDVKIVGNNLDCNAGGFTAYANKDEQGWSGWASEDEAELFATTYHFDGCMAFGDVYCESPNNAYVGGFIGKTDGAGKVELLNSCRPSSQTVEGVSEKVIASSLGTSKEESVLRSESFFTDTLGYDLTNTWYMTSVASELKLRTVAKSEGAAILSDNATLRLNDTYTGLRFTAQIEVPKRDYCFEYGFIIAVADTLGEEELTFDSSAAYVFGTAYYEGDGTDIFLEKDDDIVTFTGVLYNIPEAAYARDIVARAYVSYVCENGSETIYGNSVKASINSVAQAIKNDANAYNSLSEAYKAKLETMLP